MAAALVFGLLAGGVVPVFAQSPSLAEIAQKEAERRKQVSQSGKVYTNKDVGGQADAAPAAPAEPPKPPKASDEPKKDAEKNADKDKARPAEPAKDQAYWAGRKKELTTQLDRDQTFADALQSRINALTADFAARDDPAQRATIERDRRKAISELDRVKKAIVDDKKALADLDEEARRAGVPPGWLR